MAEVYDEDFDLDDYTVHDIYHFCVDLLNHQMPVPVDFFAKLEANGIYLAN